MNLLSEDQTNRKRCQKQLLFAWQAKGTTCEYLWVWGGGVWAKEGLESHVDMVLGVLCAIKAVTVNCVCCKQMLRCHQGKTYIKPSLFVASNAIKGNTFLPAKCTGIYLFIYKIFIFITVEFFYLHFLEIGSKPCILLPAATRKIRLHPSSMTFSFCVPLLAVLLQPALSLYNCSAKYERNPSRFYTFGRPELYWFQLNLVVSLKCLTLLGCCTSFFFFTVNSDMVVKCGPSIITLEVNLCTAQWAGFNNTNLALNGNHNNTKCMGIADTSVDPPVVRYQLPVNDTQNNPCRQSLQVRRGLLNIHTMHRFLYIELCFAWQHTKTVFTMCANFCFV